MIDKAPYPPAHLRKKVYIIDEVHMLSKGAFNALLKIMEEPPAYLVFILEIETVEGFSEDACCGSFSCSARTIKKIVIII